MTPVIHLENIRKTYVVGDQVIHALNGVSLDIYEGEYSAIIGPSGSGKSTMMQLIGCLELPTSGTILLDGKDISHSNSSQLSRLRNEKIGFVFQSFNLLPKLDVRQNVELPMIYSNIPAKIRRERAEKAIASVGLSDRIKNRPSQLSGGQCQRVAIARALVNEPKIILADEPTGALDSKTGREILNLFHELHQRGHTVTIVTHDQKIAAEAPRRISLKDGLILSDEKSDLPLASPSNASHASSQGKS